MFNCDYIPEELENIPSWLLWKEVTTEYGFKEILPCSIDGDPLKLVDLDEKKDMLKPLKEILKRANELGVDGISAGIGLLITPELSYYLIDLNDFERNQEKIKKIASLTYILEDKTAIIVIKLKNKNKNSEVQFLPFTNNHIFDEIKEFEDLNNFYNLFNGLMQEKPNEYSLAINPEAWYDYNENNEKKFDFTKCAEDIINSNEGLIITEYTSNMLFVWTGNRWLYNAENYLKSLVREHALINTYQIDQVVGLVKDRTRIIDPEKIGIPLEKLMPLPEHVLPIKDGLLNLTTGLIEPHNPRYFYITLFPRHYIKGGNSQKFKKFLDVIFENDPDKDIKQTQVYELIAWVLTNGYNPQGMALLYGKTGAGKGIITIIVIGNLIGSENYSSLSLRELNERFKTSKLYGKLANITSEIGGFLNSEMFKKVTDYSPIEIEFKGKDPFKYQSRAKWIATTNEKPDLPDPEDPKYEAYFRRIAVEISFNNILTDSLTPEEIKKWVEELTDPNELDLIFSEVVDNCYMPFVQRGFFTGYKGIEGNKEKYIEDTRPILAYLKDRQNKGMIFMDIEDFEKFLIKNNLKINMDFFSIKSEKNIIPITIEDIIEKDILKWAREKGLSTSKINKKAIGNTLTYLGYEINITDKRIKGHKFKAWYPLIILPVSNINNIFSDINKEKFKENISLKDFENIYKQSDEYEQSLHDENVEIREGTEKTQYFTGSLSSQSLKTHFPFTRVNEKNIKNYKNIKPAHEGTDILENQFNTEKNQSLDENRNFLHEGTDHHENLHLKYFRASEYYGKEFFEDMGVKLLDHFKFDMDHYYALEIPDIRNERAFKFTSRFSIKAEPVSEEDFKQKKEEAGRNDP